MNLSEIFIRRPVMTTLLMTALTFFGILAYRTLPVSSVPDVDYPTISVSISYPGTDPETIANNVVVPLEKEFMTISGIEGISSTSSSGFASIVLTFTLDRSIDLAATDVQAAINTAVPQLPQDLPYAPTYTKVNPASSPILYLTFTSDTLSLSDLFDYGNTFVGQRISMVEGVAQSVVYGSAYAVRIQLDPQKLSAKGVAVDDVANAITAANVHIPTGLLYGNKKEYTLDVSGQLSSAESYGAIIVKNSGGAVVRVNDVGRALDSLQDDKSFLYYLTKEKISPTVVLAVQKQPGTNTLAVIEKINTLLKDLEKEIPNSITMTRVFDESEYIKETIHDVNTTLLVAMILVVVVIFLYLGKVFNTIIPALVIPMSLLGTFILMHYLHFTIDILSLLAIILSIGFLVDDAIVVLENVVRHVENGERPLEATLKGSKEISFTILSMTLSLASIFVPLLFMQGILGRIFHEFSMTIIIAVLFSGAVSLSLTPVLCSTFISAKDSEKKLTKIETLSKNLNTFLIRHYHTSLEWVLNHRKTALTCGLISFLGSVYLFVLLPTDFIPTGDIGFVQGVTQAINGTSPFETARLQEKISAAIQQDPCVESVVSLSGTSQDNMGAFFARLKPLKERPPIHQVIMGLYQKTQEMIGVNIYMRPIPLLNISVGTSSSKGDYQYTLQSLNADDLYSAASDMQENMKKMRGISQIGSDLDIAQPQFKMRILRDKASLLGISAETIENTLSLAFGGGNLTSINLPNYQYYAILEFLPEFYKDPGVLSQLWLRSSSGDLVPMSQVVDTYESVGPLTINHLNGLPSVTISFNVSENFPLSSALAEVETLAQQTLPASVTGSVKGAAEVFKQTFADLNFLFFVALFIIYVILGILYEAFVPPLVIMSTIPPAALGGLATLVLVREPLSLYAFIGFILLLGIVMKNGIIMVDFANEAVHKEGMSARDAIVHACKIRFRPILMTTISAMMSALPIALGIGGVTIQSIKPLGYVIIGGLVVSQILTLFLTPVIYLYLESFREKLSLKFLHHK